MKALFCLILFSSSIAFASSRWESLQKLFADYDKRFVNGVYVPNDDQIRSFTIEQENLAATFKASGALKPILIITNSFKTSLNVKIFAMIDEQNQVTGFYFEKSSYDSDNEKSFLRFRMRWEYEKGVSFIPVNGTFALMIQGFYFKSDSATLRFTYLTDLRKGTKSALDLFLLKKNNSWDLYNTAYQPVHSAEVEVWTSLFPPNGGTKQVLLH